MLVLSRKKGEKIVINENIFITVIELSPGRVKLGIDAPKEVPIFREELLNGTKESIEPVESSV